MTGPDEEFEEFLNRRKPVFRRPEDERFEPPPELDRVVLRQAREAIEPPEPMRMFTAPRWSMPIALAATLVLALTIIFRAAMPPKREPEPEVTVQNIAEQVQAPSTSAPVARAGDAPAWRRDPKTWQAEIQRLRDAGDVARAEAEYAEFKRQQRAYAVSPDR